MKDYLTQSGQSASAFAKSVGVCQSVMSEISRGTRLPSYTVAYDIFVATGGKIRMEYWMQAKDQSNEAAPSAPGNAETHNGEIK